MRITVIGLLFVMPALLVHADTLYLRDGKVIQGTLISANSRQIRFLPDGGRAQTHVITSVDRLSFGDDASATTAAANTSSGALSPSRAANEGRRERSSRSRTDDNAVPAGTAITVRMIDPIDSNESSAGQTYRASVDEPVVVNGRTVVPQGADATVQVVRVNQSGTVSGREEIALVLSELRANNRTLTPQTQHAEVAAKSRSKESAKVIGGTAVVGAIIGAIAGGGKGAAIGAASGAGAGTAIQVIRGQRIQVPSETKLDFTLAEPMNY